MGCWRCWRGWKPGRGNRANEAVLMGWWLPRLGDCAHRRTFRQEYGGSARAGLLWHAGGHTEWLAPDVLAVPWWRVA